MWDGGGGFFLDTVNEQLMISNFGATWGQKGDVGGLFSSEVGYASFTVSGNGVDPFDGNFQIGAGLYGNTANQVVRVNFNGGQGAWEPALNPAVTTRVEILWNNSNDPTPKDFETDSGWVGTIASDSAVRIFDGNPATNVWQGIFPVAVGTAADRAGFWIASSTGQKAAIIDDLLVWDTLEPTAGIPGDFDGDSDVDGNDFLEWQRTDGTPAGLTEWEDHFGTGAVAVVSAVPEPTALALAIPALLGDSSSKTASDLGIRFLKIIRNKRARLVAGMGRPSYRLARLIRNVLFMAEGSELTFETTLFFRNGKRAVYCHGRHFGCKCRQANNRRLQYDSELERAALVDRTGRCIGLAQSIFAESKCPEPCIRSNCR